LFIWLGQNFFALQTAENSAQRRAGFAADGAESDDEVAWDDAEEEEDAGSQTAVESSSATHGDEGSEELVDLGEPLSHSSKFPGPSFLRDWSKDDDDETGSVATLGGAALHIAAAASIGAQAPPTVDLPESPEQHPVASELADHEGTRSGSAGTKRRGQPTPTKPAEKHGRPEPATKNLLHPKMKKVTKWRATAVAG
jgi:hypothetical protein